MSQYAASGIPSTYSITKYGSPLSVVPASNTLAIALWLIAASAFCSSRKRAMTSLVAMPCLMTLTATMRRDGVRCSARNTSPMPPWPRRARMR